MVSPLRAVLISIVFITATDTLVCRTLLLQKLLTEVRICLSCGAISALAVSLVFAGELLLSRKNLNCLSFYNGRCFGATLKIEIELKASSDSLERAEDKRWPKSCVWESVRLNLHTFIRYKKKVFTPQVIKHEKMLYCSSFDVLHTISDA